MNRAESGGGWDEYLTEFHARRAGITERILERSIAPDGTTPYDWVTERIPDTGLVVDVACGSAPLWGPRFGDRYLGIDASAAELALADRRGAHALIHGTADTLPVGDGAAGIVVCSMALQILPDLATSLTEIRRILDPDGQFVAIVPTGPAGAKDIAFGAGLVRTAGGTLGYRNDPLLRRPGHLFAEHGLTIVGDATRTYRFDLTAPGAPAEAASSLYLRGAQAARVDRVAAYLERAARHGRTMPVPIRRILATPRQVSP